MKNEWEYFDENKVKDTKFTERELLKIINSSVDFILCIITEVHNYKKQ